MHAKPQQNPTWPYLGMLLVLFILSWSAPRNWEQSARKQGIAPRPTRAQPFDMGGKPARRDPVFIRQQTDGAAPMTLSLRVPKRSAAPPLMPEVAATAPRVAGIDRVPRLPSEATLPATPSAPEE